VHAKASNRKDCTWKLFIAVNLPSLVSLRASNAVDGPNYSQADKNTCYYEYTNKNMFVDDIETHSIRIQKKEDALAKVQATLQSTREEAKEIQKQIKEEKYKQISTL
jgi:septal ring factor EnvC (AmiA/AmiB activator)